MYFDESYVPADETSQLSFSTYSLSFVLCISSNKKGIVVTEQDAHCAKNQQTFRSNRRRIIHPLHHYGQNAANHAKNSIISKHLVQIKEESSSSSFWGRMSVVQASTKILNSSIQRFNDSTIHRFNDSTIISINFTTSFDLLRGGRVFWSHRRTAKRN
uniref:uncharacterized protein LOC127070578 n=1 Tax=Vespula vulgaris TaxID=7454 RepID=UPI00213684ED|nr:uncharacterized protein LOC127070578 [Vespula vulgaris]XP_050864664.1 uncharacterized protein LOC127070578 [Vespula vulgaris]